MLKGLAASVALAGAVWAGQANATTMLAELVGGFNDDPYWIRFKAELKYDTSLGTLVTTADGNKLSWSVADGGPSPLLSAHVVVTPRTVPAWYAGPCDPAYPNPYCDLPTSPIDVFVTDFSSFTLTRTLEDYLWEATTITPFFLQIGVDTPFWDGPGGGGLGDAPGTDLRLTAPYDRPSTAPYIFSSYYGSWSLDSASGSPGSPYTDGIKVSALAVPEPATWAMLLLGFFGVGAAVRRRRVASFA